MWHTYSVHLLYVAANEQRKRRPKAVGRADYCTRLTSFKKNVILETTSIYEQTAVGTVNSINADDHSSRFAIVVGHPL